jgi:hypothetical protein
LWHFYTALPPSYPDPLLTAPTPHPHPNPPQVHGDALIAHPDLAGVADRMRRRLAASWRRLDDLLQGARCVVDFLSNTVA